MYFCSIEPSLLQDAAVSAKVAKELLLCGKYAGKGVAGEQEACR